MSKLKIKIILTVVVGLAAVLAFALPKWNEARVLDEGVVAVKNSDYGRAVQILTPLSDAGNPIARDTLGLLYAYGWGVKRDRERAATLMAAAGTSNLPDRFFSIGQEFEEGKVVEKDQKEALEWFRLAAEAGHPQAKVRFSRPGR
jgi:uncharacterized protein